MSGLYCSFKYRNMLIVIFALIIFVPYLSLNVKLCYVISCLVRRIYLCRMSFSYLIMFISYLLINIVFRFVCLVIIYVFRFNDVLYFNFGDILLSRIFIFIKVMFLIKCFRIRIMSFKCYFVLYRPYLIALYIFKYICRV